MSFNYDTDADVVVLAGDINTDIKMIPKWALDRFPGKEIVYVPGNHEYYGKDMYKVLSVFAAIKEEHDSGLFHLLLDDWVEINEVLFTGNTMWTDFELDGPNVELAMQNAKYNMSDFGGSIFNMGRMFTPQMSREEHGMFTFCLKLTMQKALDENKPLVVVSHHGCHYKSLDDRYTTSEINPAFHSDMSRFMEPDSPIKVWVHGHTHCPKDYYVNNTRVVCNPRGYPYFANGHMENDEWSPTKIVELDY